MKECEDWRYSVLFLRKAGAPPVTDALWNEVQPMIEHVNRLYLQSYNDLRRVTKGKWSDAIRDGTVEEIAKIVSSLKFDRTIRMSMEVRGIRETEEFKANDSWTPRRLAKWLGLYEGDDVAYEDVMDISGHYLPSVRFYKELPEEYYWFTQDSVEAVNCE